ncbi:uncharacterized protein LAESUDRAFT_671705 [Laetiporus sulphureus 93-53]|uniref:Sterol regulatory element-binding protein cleavage-activating protein n=1 Tax=Laetiporus sulphureus 93-53 TaxID=1314785 RepID=A0A165HD80_9APHY|nr:uncharacterized protein LAESUDRAFT_671705 [Laetiporus sulphureus 93-53]KZT11580.1 hypothetical protein LAESUDRAFT_671705 [Laetiporus sulphureus 93-53]
MYSLPTPAVLQRIREYGTKFFHRFGIHCATHQVRLILVSSIVITSLLFPAIAVYSSPETRFFAGFTLSSLDPFVPSDDISSYFAQHDLHQLWEGHSTLRVREDSVARAQCGVQGILRSERILIGRVSQDYGLEALDQHTLLSALELERRISRVLAKRRVPCLKTASATCFSISPLALWDYDESTLAEDGNILDTLNLSHNVTVSGIPISPDMVLAGRELRDPSSSDVDSAMFLALTYFFPDRDCVGNVGHFQWLRALEEAAGYSGDLLVQTQTPKLIALEYDKDASTKSRFSILSVFCYMAYVGLFVYCAKEMRHMDTVHSGFGLAVTGCIELIVSTITSLSVCALVGFRVTMVPWELFPIIVMFIGAENMFHIVDAVLKTSVTIPVKERIAQGLSRAGTSNTLKVVSYNAVLGVIAFFSTGAIRQFCAFSIVVLVAHWFLVHTFFVTVLSIDIQRLELDELLRQNTNLAPINNTGSTVRSLPPPRTWSQTVTAMKNTIRGRSGKNLSLFLLLAIAATLYYATSPSGLHNKETLRSPLARSPLRQNNRMSATDLVSPAFRIWHTLNPTDDTLIHIRVESPTILVLASAEGQHKDHVVITDNERAPRPRMSGLSRLWSRAVKPLLWLVKIIVVPITITTLLLYALLLYLLKNVELLEEKRQRPERDSQSSEESSVEEEISFTTLPRAIPTDVEVIAASKNGSVVVTLGLQNEVVIWRTDTRTHITVDTSSILLCSSSTQSAATTLMTVAVNDAGTVCAVGSGTGIIGVWSIGRDSVKPLTQLSLENAAIFAVAQLQFATSQHHPSAPILPFTPSQPSETVPSIPKISLYAAYENGSVVKWEIDAVPRAHYVAPSRSASIIKSMLLPVHGDNHLLVGFSLEDGTFELCDIEQRDRPLVRNCWIAAGNPHDLVCRVDLCKVELGGKNHVVIGAATQAGIVSLWDAGTRECLFIMEETFGEINHLRLTPVKLSTCTVCGELPCENFLISFSVGQVILFYRAYLYLPTRRCSCPRNQPQPAVRTSVLGHRSRSGSSASVVSNGATTPTHRPKVPSVSSTSSALNASMFPVSAHGVHSRRATEKENLRRNHDAFFINSEGDDSETRLVGPVDVTPAAGFLSSHPPTSVWQSLVVIRVADAVFERGSWDVAGDKIVGVRRRPRPPFRKLQYDDTKVPIESPHGLSASTLERWELWTFDPEDSRITTSPLTALSRGVEESDTRSSMEHQSGRAPASPQRRRRSDNLIPRLHFTRVAPFISSSTFCLAGFGNTVGLFNLNNFTTSRRRRRRSSADSTRSLSS